MVNYEAQSGHNLMLCNFYKLKAKVENWSQNICSVSSLNEQGLFSIGAFSSEVRSPVSPIIITKDLP